MANRVLLGNRTTGGHGLYVSKSGQNVLTCADNQLLFDSRKSRTGQIYAGAIAINFVSNSNAVKPSVVGTTNIFVNFATGTNLTGKKIIIDGTTVTLSTTTTQGGNTFTSAANIVTDINAASISNITANIRTISSGNQRLRILKNSTTNDLVISYPSSNSLETTVGISPETYQVGKLDTSGINWITGSGAIKASLGFVPLILFTERNMGELDSEAQSDGEVFSLVSNTSLFESTQTHCIPVSAEASQPSSDGTGTGGNNAAVFSQETPSAGRFYEGGADEEDYECKNATFYVLRIPCAYGYMNNTYFG